jgi:hypothetical protein
MENPVSKLLHVKQAGDDYTTGDDADKKPNEWPHV